jgi:hypothetical protein
MHGAIGLLIAKYTGFKAFPGETTPQLSIRPAFFEAENPSVGRNVMKWQRQLSRMEYPPLWQ